MNPAQRDRSTEDPRVQSGMEREANDEFRILADNHVLAHELRHSFEGRSTHGEPVQRKVPGAHTDQRIKKLLGWKNDPHGREPVPGLLIEAILTFGIVIVHADGVVHTIGFRMLLEDLGFRCEAFGEEPIIRIQKCDERTRGLTHAQITRCRSPLVDTAPVSEEAHPRVRCHQLMAPLQTVVRRAVLHQHHFANIGQGQGRSDRILNEGGRLRTPG